jgi:hypothetical protein
MFFKIVNRLREARKLEVGNTETVFSTHSPGCPVAEVGVLPVDGSVGVLAALDHARLHDLLLLFVLLTLRLRRRLPLVHGTWDEGGLYDFKGSSTT